MEYLLIVTAFKYDKMTKDAINSIMESDYDGIICLVTPDAVEDNIAGIKVVNIPEMKGFDTLLHVGAKAMGRKYDYLIWMHNDVILPKVWFKKLDAANIRLGSHLWCITIPSIGPAYKNPVVVGNPTDIVGSFNSYRHGIFTCCCSIRYDYMEYLWKDWGGIHTSYQSRY